MHMFNNIFFSINQFKFKLISAELYLSVYLSVIMFIYRPRGRNLKQYLKMVFLIKCPVGTKLKHLH